MVLDCEAQILYVYGGRIIDGDWASTKYAGLYSYNIRLAKWQHLQCVSFLLLKCVVLGLNSGKEQSEAQCVLQRVRPSPVWYVDSFRLCTGR
jgi:hypothetical protein